MSGRPKRERRTQYDASEAHLSERLYLLKNRRRGVLSRVTRLENSLLQKISTLTYDPEVELMYTEIIENMSNLRRINTEYLLYETDKFRIKEATDLVEREESRIIETRNLIERYLQKVTKHRTQLQYIQSDQEDSVSSHSYLGLPNRNRDSQGSDGFGAQSRSLSSEGNVFEDDVGPLSVRPPCTPRSQSSRHGLKYMRKYKITSIDSGRTVNKTGCLPNNQFKPFNMNKTSEPVDKFIDRLIEGEETTLVGDSRTVSASSALRHEFESKNLPSIELVKFSGDSSKWPEFIENFARRIHFKLSFTDNDRMERLISVLSGEAKKAVECVGTSGIFYASALKLLKRDFGNPTVVTHLKLKQLFERPQIVQTDRISLRRYHQHLKSTLTWLKVMGYYSALTSTDNLTKAVMRLPNNLRQSFFKYSRKSMSSEINNNPNLIQFEQWLDNRLKEYYNPIANIIASKEQHKPRDKANRSNSEPKASTFNIKAKERKSKEEEASEVKPKCWVCSKPHKIWVCDIFKGKPVEERRTTVRDIRLCYNCLSPNHQVKSCQSKRSCKECDKRHHSLLHISKDKDNADVEEDTEHTTSAYGSFNVLRKRKGYLQVIPVIVSNGNLSVETNALLDPGSDTTLIKSELAKRLNLQGEGLDLEISNVLSRSKRIKTKLVDFSISSRFHPDRLQVEEAWVVDRLNVDHQPINVAKLKKKYSHLKSVPLSSLVDDDVSILIGADLPEAVLHLEFRMGGAKEPIAVRTLLGWALFGGKSNSQKTSSNFVSTRTLNTMVERFWEIESYGTLPKLAPSLLTRKEKKAVEILNKTTVKKGKQYEVGMLWADDDVSLINNRELAVTRLKSTEKRLRRLPDIKASYKKIMKQYVDDGHARKLTSSECEESAGRTNYIPHHFVLEPNKPDKIRIVFDAAAKYKNDCLNDHLLPGPDLLNNLVTVLSNFRTGKIAVIGDIKRMFHQVLVPETEQDSLRFLWREEDSDKISEFKMKVHLFGKKDSPCCANWALRKCAETQCNQEIARAILNDFYMDDYLGSFNSLKETIEITQGLTTALKNGGFKLTKWISNSKEFLQSIPKAEISSKIIDLNLDDLPAERALGVWWDPKTDNFHFRLKKLEYPETKRGLLSFISSIFDPLGFLTPILITPKLLLQRLWTLKLDWDEKIPDDIVNEFREWKLHFLEIENIRIPRWFQYNYDEADIVELHIFSDASMKCYGVVAYLRSVQEKKVNCSLLMAKSRLAPLRRSTTPRLELQGAVVAARMKECILDNIGISVHNVFLWTDSEVTLKCIKNEERHFSSYVMNRVHEIREKTDIKDWYFIQGIKNMADKCTRSCNVQACKEWFTGPQFLLNETLKFESTFDGDTKMVEEFEEVASINIIQKHDEMSGIIQWHKYSDWSKLLRHYAWIIKLKSRWLQKRRTNTDVSITTLDGKDLLVATNELCRISQQESEGTLNLSKLSSLRPTYIEEILCVGGRLSRASIPHQSKHQVILSSKHPISKLLASHFHQKSFHSGRNATLSLIRERFWIIKGKSLIRKVINDCLYCKRQRIEPVIPMMSDLPEERLALGSHPFSYVGVDYFGPMYVKQGRRGRNSTGTTKRYGALFSCLTTRSLHLELAGDLSTDSFILALRRFRGRRGDPKVIRSDNGTNFVGANKELYEAMKSMDQSKLQKELANHHIEWRFNPPYSPWMGGAMESMVKLVKRSLKAIVTDRIFTEEALNTFLVEVESTINSRPLTPLSDDISDYEALTPNHFLLGHPSHNVEIGINNEINLRTKWRSVQAATSMFWQRWIKEYLPSLTERSKWVQETKNLQVGDLVLISDKKSKRCHWPLARIIKLGTSADGRVRHATLRKSNGDEVVRPSASLCVLESFECSH